MPDRSENTTIKQKYADNEKVVIDGLTYEFCSFYNRLRVCLDDRKKTISEIRCPNCHGDTFKIGYGNYECIAYCQCGTEMTVYDG